MALPFAIAAGYFSDKISPKYTFPYVFAFRFVVMTLYCFVESPGGWLAYLLSVFLLPAGYQMFVVVQGFLAKRFPKDIRGTMFSIMSLTIAIACVIYAGLGTWLTFVIGPCAIYLIIAVCDLCFLIWVTILIFMGKFGYQNKKRLASMSEMPFDASIKITLMDKISEDVDENTNTEAKSLRENSGRYVSGNFGGNMKEPITEKEFETSTD
mmetsp:Transcript_119460/g.166660  ORF Transcript_119460/g.166660 Transcript_119460/m.166660 type:complete len:210 (+) Transcript_119460:1196-1825(+)